MDFHAILATTQVRKNQDAHTITSVSASASPSHGPRLSIHSLPKACLVVLRSTSFLSIQPAISRDCNLL